MSEFHPSYNLTRLEFLELENRALKKAIAILQEHDVENSWAKNPDRSGGAFTRWEIDNAKAWK